MSKVAKKGAHSPSAAPAPKLTRNQSVVMQALEGAARPLTAYEILDLKAVREKGLKAPLTIYRALDKLIVLGLAHRIESLNAFMPCGMSCGDGDPSDHGHTHPATGFIICRDCGRTVELQIDDCEDHLGASARKAGFAVDDIRVEMTGLCRDCG